MDMKNIKVLYESDEVMNYVKDQFKTDFFKTEVAKEGSIINKVTSYFAKYPAFFFDMTDKHNEHAHFYSWFGGIPHREYENPYIHDLYLLHEMYHKGNMAYVKGDSFENFKLKIFQNELHASTVSEIAVYLHYPELREKTFPHKIYADKFLGDESFMKEWKADPRACYDIIVDKRRNIMKNENPHDPIEYWIHKFSAQNDVWASNWKIRYDEVEGHIAELQKEIRLGGNKKEAMDKYMNWLTSPEVTKGTDIPFPDEAKAFAGMYHLNREYYNEAVKGNIFEKTMMDKLSQMINSAFPDKNKTEIIQELAKNVLGPLPGYSNRENYQITNVTGLAPGSFLIPYHIDKTQRNTDSGRNGLPMIFMQRRSDKLSIGKGVYGAFGGYTNVDDNPAKNSKKEQPNEGAIRELGEEVVNDKGNPVIEPVPSRLKLLCAGNDYRPNPAVAYTGFSLELDKTEIKALTSHIQKMQTEPNYKTKVQEASHGEVAEIMSMPINEVLKLGKESFAHPHEFDAIQELANQLKGLSTQKKR